MAFPSVHGCLVCEAARREPSGMYNLLGYYGICPDVRVGVRDFGLPVSFCFVFGAGPSQAGQYRVGVKLADSKGHSFDGEVYEGDLKENTMGTNIFLRFQGVLPGADTYAVLLFVDGQPVFASSFQLGQMT